MHFHLPIFPHAPYMRVRIDQPHAKQRWCMPLHIHCIVGYGYGSAYRHIVTIKLYFNLRGSAEHHTDTSRARIRKHNADLPIDDGIHNVINSLSRLSDGLLAFQKHDSLPDLISCISPARATRQLAISNHRYLGINNIQTHTHIAHTKSLTCKHQPTIKIDVIYVEILPHASSFINIIDLIQTHDN